MRMHSRYKPWLRYLTLAAGLLLAAPGVAADPVNHFVSYPQDKQQYLQVRSEFPVNSAVTEVIMPNWTPGAYIIKNFGANVDRISATSQDGTPLLLQQISKDTWRIQTQDVQQLIVEYEVYTPKLAVLESWVEPDFTLINGTSVFLYTLQTRSSPQTLSVDAGDERGDVFTALPVVAGMQMFRARNYDELVDSPVVVAKAPAHRFNTGGQEYIFVNVGESAFWDAAKATADLQKMVEATQSLWRVNPLNRPYWFLNFSVGAKGGLEHDHSTVTFTGRGPMQNRSDYIKWLGLMSHEFFHTWNVRRMRPAALLRYDYQNEQYSSQLWLAEGFTSYYDNLLLSRAGLITPQEYLGLLATDMYLLLNTPGRKLRSVSEASLEAWSRHYQPHGNTLNSTISYYNKGAVIGFVLDAYLRERSKGRNSLDDLMRELYRRHATQGYSPDDFMAVVTDLGGAEAAAFTESLINSTDDPDVDTALDWFGLELRRHDLTGQSDNGLPAAGDFGVIWDIRQTAPLVKSVRAGSASAKAGLLPGDEVLALGSERMTRTNYAQLMQRFHPGQNTTLLVSRRGQIKTLNLTLDTALPDHYIVAVQQRITRQTLKRLQEFLGQDL